MNKVNNNYKGIYYMPNGEVMCELLTEQEAIKFLRLDSDGPQHPELTLQHYRKEGLLKATRVGKRLRYLRTELLKFLEEKTHRADGDIS